MLAAGLLTLMTAGAAEAQQSRANRPYYSRATPETPYLINPDWADSLKIDFPASALAAGITRARVAVDCAVQPGGALTDCRVTEETPVDLGLAQLTLDATTRARIANAGADSPANLRVDFVAIFSAPAPSVRIGSDRTPPVITPSPPRPSGPTPARSTVVTMPTWARAPHGVLPERAIARGLTTAFVGLKCRLEQNGALTSCMVLNESTPGLGLGAAALTAARTSRASPRTVDGAEFNADILVWVPFYRAQEPAR